MESGSDIKLQAPEAIYLNTPNTIIAGGITAGGVSGDSARSLRSAFRATFNMPVDFKYVFTAPDGIIGNISFNKHGHEESIGGDTDVPKEV